MATYDLVVIGTGPGGYVCAIRAAQLPRTKSPTPSSGWCRTMPPTWPAPFLMCRAGA